MIAYNYNIRGIKREITGLIIFVEYEIIASDGENSNTHTFHTALASPKNDIIPFEKVTKENIVLWIKNMFDTINSEGNRENPNEEQAKEELAASILRKPEIIGLPWY